MASKKINWTEEQLGAMLAITHVASKASGFEEAAEFVMREASICFMKDNANATPLKAMSMLLSEKAKVQRSNQAELQGEYDKQYRDT